jgi:hypothetical protein
MKNLSPLVALLLVAGCGGEITDISNLSDVNIYTIIGECSEATNLGGSVACVSSELPPDALPPEEGGCWITGIGHIGSDLNLNGISDKPGAGAANQDSFGGNAKGMKSGIVKGQWQNTTHLADGKHKFHGEPNFLFCWNDGGPGPDVPKAYPNRAIWAGPGKWDHQDGYVFIASAADYKEGKDGADANIRDAYAITVYKDEDGDGVASAGDTIVYEETDCVYGNFQIHPPNNGHPYVPAQPNAEMDRIRTTQDLCPGPDPNW